jgi:hypothetical protein
MLQVMCGILRAIGAPMLPRRHREEGRRWLCFIDLFGGGQEAIYVGVSSESDLALLMTELP